MPALDQYPQGILNGTIGALLLGSIVASGCVCLVCLDWVTKLLPLAFMALLASRLSFIFANHLNLIAV